MSDNIENAKSASTATFVTALVFNAAVFGVEIALFTLLRPRFKAIYEPLTYILPKKIRAKPLTSSLFLWPVAIYRGDYHAIIQRNGMDAYFFVHFLRMMIKVFLPIWIISWVVLFPVTAVNTHVDGKDSLDKLTYSDVSNTQSPRYAAHLVLVYLFTGWIFYNIKREMSYFIITRQQHFLDPLYAKSVQASTILVTGIPAKYLTQDALLRLFGHLPGGVKRIWINRNLKELPDVYDQREAASSKLESAETQLMKTAAKLRAKALKKQGKTEGSAEQHSHIVDVESQNIVPRKDRPSHRLGFLPFTGEKVDTIEWARHEIVECTRILDEGRSKISQADERGAASPDLGSEDDDRNGEETGNTPESGSDVMDHDEHSDEAREGGVKKVGKQGKELVGKIKGKVTSGEKGFYPPMNSAFVTFERQVAAQLAVQVLAHHEPYRMSKKYVDVSPQDVIWSNLNMNPYEQRVRLAVSYAATAALIIFWAIPVAFVGTISNIHAVCERASWLAWICELPDVVIGIISGILPPVLLAVLMMLLPIVLRLLARFEGIPKKTGLELSLMTRFFIFQVVHSFLIVTLSSGIVASLGDLLNNPSSIPNILAQNLPQASTFFLTYIILQGLSGVAGGFLQIVPLIIYYVKLFILGSTPRSVYGIKYSSGSVAWGTTFPSITLLVVITLGYSIISPVINGLAWATFVGFYFLYKYLFLWVYKQDKMTDTGGLFFPKAIQHIFVGMYVQQICLCALFFLAQKPDKKPSAIPEGVLMIVLIVLTAGYHMIINNSYGPLLSALPLSLADRTYSPSQQLEQEREQQQQPAAQSTSSSPVIPSATGKARVSMDDDHSRLMKPLPDPYADKGQRTEVEDGLSTEEEEGERDEDQEASDKYGFAHPAAVQPQRAVWIPKDTLGLWNEETKGCKEAGVSVSTRGATMNEKGKVNVNKGPPVL